MGKMERGKGEKRKYERERRFRDREHTTEGWILKDRQKHRNNSQVGKTFSYLHCMMLWSGKELNCRDHKVDMR